MIRINPRPLEGIWTAGIALDLHTIRSVPAGEDDSGRMRFDTKRPPVAELLYALKYQGNLAAAPLIVDAAVGFLRRHQTKMFSFPSLPPDHAPSNRSRSSPRASATP